MWLAPVTDVEASALAENQGDGVENNGLHDEPSNRLSWLAKSGMILRFVGRCGYQGGAVR